jgi:hypothetical protein
VSEETLDDLPAIHGLATELRAARWSLFFLVAVGGRVLKPITADACEELFERLLDLGDGGGAGRGPIITTTEAPHFRRVVLERARRAGPVRPPCRKAIWATARASATATASCSSPTPAGYIRPDSFPSRPVMRESRIPSPSTAIRICSERCAARIS